MRPQFAKMSIGTKKKIIPKTLQITTKPDNFIFSVYWDNKDKIINRGNFIARGYVVRNPNTGSSILTVNIDSSNIYSRNNLWKISNSSIIVDSNSVVINKFYIKNQDHYYLVDGSVSENPSDTLNLEFRGIDISPLNFLGNQMIVLIQHLRFLMLVIKLFVF